MAAPLIQSQNPSLDELRARRLGYPQVMSEEDTLDLALSGRSISRFGDGELLNALGLKCRYEQPSEKLAADLRNIALGHTKALVCIPNVYGGTPRQKSWEQWAAPRITDLYDKTYLYGSSLLSRPDSMPHINRPDYWDKVRSLWRGRDVTLVRGSDLSLTPSILRDASSVREVVGPAHCAYAEIVSLECEIGTPDGPVILCLGPTATVLAARLADKNVWALDLGFIGNFMRED